MLHDEILRECRRLAVFYKNNVPSHVGLNVEAYRAISVPTMEALASPDVQVVYADINRPEFSDDNLNAFQAGGQDFIDRGLFKTPYKRTLFMFKCRGSQDWLPLFMERFDGSVEYRVVVLMPVRSIKAVGNTPIPVLAGFTNKDHFFIPEHLVSLIDGVNQKAALVELILGLKHVVAINQAMNTKFFDKEPVVISEALQKARKRSGKTPLSGYINVTMKKDVAKRFEGTDEKGKPRAPHFRRGHFRHLKEPDGMTEKVVFVSECLVNWDGPDEDLVKKSYFVGGPSK